MIENGTGSPTGSQESEAQTSNNFSALPFKKLTPRGLYLTRERLLFIIAAYGNPCPWDRILTVYPRYHYDIHKIRGHLANLKRAGLITEDVQHGTFSLVQEAKP